MNSIIEREARIVKIKSICPTCFAQDSHSVVMTQEDEVYQCTRDSGHRFKKDEDGFYVRA